MMSEPPPLTELPRPLPWCKFPNNLIRMCKAGQIASAIDVRNMVICVADYLRDELKDTRTGTMRLVARSICDTYPESFADYLGDKMIGNGVESLVKRIGNRISYLSCMSKAERKPSKNSNTNASADDPADSSSKKSCRVILDAYGTVAYQPGLPPAETEETQKQKKEFLICEFAKMTGRDESKITAALRNSYPSQRIAINTRDSRFIDDILNDWPFLRDPIHFCQHASELLGKESVYNEFVKNVAANFTIHDYMQHYVNVQRKKFKDKVDERVTSLSKILKESSAAARAPNIPLPQAVALFPLLLAYFDEENAIYKVVEKTTSDATILSFIDKSTPLAVIKGESLYDKDTTCIVLVEKKICFRCSKSTTAILISFLCYYVFGLKYAVESRKTLEFIQRVFLGINSAGSKATTGKKRKRQAGDVDASVMKLVNTLHKYWTPNETDGDGST